MTTFCLFSFTCQKSECYAICQFLKHVENFRLRQQQSDEKKNREDFDREGRHKLRELEREARYGGRGGDRDRDRDRDRYRDRDGDRGRDRGSAKERDTEEKEKEAVRERYLGGVKKKKKVSKASFFAGLDHIEFSKTFSARVFFSANQG